METMAVAGPALPSQRASTASVYVLARDVSEQIEAQQRLADSERRFRVTQHRAPLPLLELSPAGRILSVNAAACTFYGRSALELLEEDFESLFCPDDVREGAEDSAQALHKTLRGEVEAYRTTKRFSRPDGSVRWGDLSVGVVRDRSGGVERLVAQVLDVTDARQMAAELEHRSLHDALTGLANRDLLLDHLEGAIRRKRRTSECVAVLFVDLDHFKLVNDTFGHAAGDLVLCTVAQRLRSVCRETDTVGRLGGDEMVVVAEGLSCAQDAYDMADRLMEAVGHPMSIEGQVYVPSISVGLTTSESDDRTPADLLRDADSALYRAKERGRGRWERFDRALRVQAGERLAGETTLRSALSHENGFDFEAEFQPVVELGSGMVVGVEALARISRGGRPALEPEEFIPIAEDHGLILRLGTRMLNYALERLADGSQGPSASWWVSVNVSPLELADPDYNQSLQHWLAVYSVDPTRLVLEITERSLLSTSAACVQRLRQIADLGVRWALDDFGTGFASLRNLHDLPISVVKLDRSLIGRLESDPAERSMTAALAELTAQLGLMGIVEGIETPGQRDILHAQGWTFGQGYFFPAI
jgi:diguanylate cyclase (GGDEF)-like protein/PAS domain S-box-containing protein